MARRPKIALTSPEDVITPKGQDKSYPDSLRWILIAIREQLHNKLSPKEFDEFAKHLNEIGRKYSGKHSKARFGLSAPKIRELEEQGGTPPLYSHLEKYAYAAHVPTGLLLLFSFLVSVERDGNTVLIPRVAKALQEIFEGISASTKFDVEELKRWGSIYTKHDPSLANRGVPLLHATFTRKTTAPAPKGGDHSDLGTDRKDAGERGTT